MRQLREWFERLIGSIRPSRRDPDMAEELRLHLELAAEDARRRGASPDEAMRAAVIQVGAAAPAMEAMRDQRGMLWLEDLGRDVAYGLRALRRNKGFTATAVLSLALGIGANAGIFSLLDQVLLRPLPVADPERLVQLEWRSRDGGFIGVEYGDGALVSYPFCRELQRQTGVFEAVFCRYPAGVNLSAGGAVEQAQAELVSGPYFAALGLRPALGRFIDQSDEQTPGAHPVVVLSHDYWRLRLGGAADAIGRRVFVNSQPMTVIGIAPPGFRGVELDQVPALWIPAMMKRQITPDWDGLEDRRTFWLHGIGRLKPGVTAEQARARLAPWFQAELAAETRAEGFPAVSDRQRNDFLASTLEVWPAARGVSTLRSGLRRPLLVLMSGTLLLLLLAALNVAGLLIARGAARTRELTTRMALGASRGRIARQLLIESSLLTILGGVAGVLAAPLVSRTLRSYVPEGANLTASLDGRVLLFTFAAAAAVAAVCGLAPVLQMARLRLSAALTERSGLGATAGVRLRKVLVGGQITFALILLMGAGVFVQTLVRLQWKGPGFATERLVMFSVDPPASGHSYEQSERIMRELLRRLQELPGVQRVAVANTQMLSGGTSAGSYTIEAGGRQVTDRLTHRMRVSPGFLPTLGVALTEGRDFDERDVRPAGTPQRRYHTAIVNETFARRYFGDGSPVGARVGSGNRPGTVTDIEIIGVVREVNRRTLRDRDIDQIFLNYWDNQSDNGAFYIRTRGTPAAAFPGIRAAVAAVDPSLPVLGLKTVDDQIRESLRTERALAMLSTGFGLIALVICIVGIYGVMAFVTAQRTQELGVRIALGASRGAALLIVLREAMALVAAGALVAVPMAWVLRRYVEGELFGVAAFDGPTIASAGGGLAFVALGASALPAWRAVVLPPMAAIRDQPETMWQTARQSVGRVIRELRADRAPASVTAAALVGGIGSLVQRADSFPEAIRVALASLSEQLNTRFAILLSKQGDRYRDEQHAIPARGVLLNRLTHYPHPLPLTPGDFDTWRRWAEDIRPEYLDEIESLERSGARLAVALRTRHDIVGVLLIGAPAGRNRFFPGELELVASAAGAFALMVENARLSERALEQEKVRRDLALAAEVQRRLLPPQPPQVAGVALAAYTLPARTVGGDYYDFMELPGGQLGIAIADIAGKGIAAALLMSVVQASLRVLSSEGRDGCARLATTMNRFLHRSTASNGYATFFYAQLDPQRRQLRYVNAGHTPPYLVRRTASSVDVIELSVGGTVLGLFPDVAYEDGAVDLLPGDLLVACTDGITEARNADDEEFGEERVKALLRRIVGAPAAEVSAHLAAEVLAWSAGAEQHDDLTFVVATM